MTTWTDVSSSASAAGPRLDTAGEQVADGMLTAAAVLAQGSLRDRPLLTHEQAVEVVALFELLANETRLRLIHALDRAGELTVTELADAVGTSQQAVSNQLQRLVDRRILVARRNGKHVHYLWGAQTSSCSSPVLMEETAEQVTSEHRAVLTLTDDAVGRVGPGPGAGAPGVDGAGCSAGCRPEGPVQDGRAQRAAANPGTRCGRCRPIVRRRRSPGVPAPACAALRSPRQQGPHRTRRG